jgi:hypothetical protein
LREGHELNEHEVVREQRRVLLDQVAPTRRRARVKGIVAV